MYLAVSSNAAWHLTGGKPVLAGLADVYPETRDAPDRAVPQLWELHALEIRA